MGKITINTLMIRQIFMCNVCKTNHNLQFPDDFAKERPKYPFSYVYLHPYQGDDKNIEMQGKTVLTTLYIDANCKIRGQETVLQDKDIEIMAKGDTLQMVTQLTEYINELQKNYEELEKKYNELKEKVG